MMTLLAGGKVNQTALRRAVDLTSILVGVDSGGDAALRLGYTPDAVIGDLDSLSEGARATLGPERLHLIAEQDTIDFDKALRSLPDVPTLAVGLTGLRLDHTLAAFSVLARHPARRVVVLGETDLAFHCPARLTLDLPAGSRFSLFPMAPVRGRSRGLRWPIDGIAFAPAGMIGTSNQVTEGRVELAMEGAGMIVILPLEALDAVWSVFAA